MLIHVPPQVRVLAMDVHKNTISIGLLEPGSDSPLLDRVSADDEAVRRLIGGQPTITRPAHGRALDRAPPGPGPPAVT